MTAAAQVLIDRGYERATTARIAKRAGVSIGSLYQYFPNKDALISALIELHADQIVGHMRRVLQEAESASFGDGLRMFIRAGIATHRIHPDLHKILTEQIPRVGRLAVVMDTHRRIAALIEEFLRMHVREIGSGRDLAVMSVVIETALESLVHRAIIERRDLLPEDVVEEEAFRLVMGYLARRTQN